MVGQFVAIEAPSSIALDRYISDGIQASVATLQGLFEQVDTLTRIARSLADALRNGNTVFVCGNGGSASEAQHFVGELVGRFERERRGLAALALGTDPSVLTALANDYGYAIGFRRQIEALGRPGDVLVSLSTSGNSPNVIEAVTAARERGMLTIGLTGLPGGALAHSADACLRIESSATPRVQEAHLLVIHLICGMIEQMLFGEPQ